MRIAFDSRSVYRGMGGIGRYAWSLLCELALIDSENEYFCYFTHLEPPEPIRLPARFRLRIFEAGMIDERFDQLILPTLLKEDEIDLYHNPTFSVPLVRTQTRTVATIHDVVFRRHPELVEVRLRRYLDDATRRSCKHSDRVITVSNFSKEEIVRLYGAKDELISVIHNGVTPPVSPNLDREGSARLILQQGLAPGGYVLYVGSIEKKKNVDLLLRAFREIDAPDKDRPIQLVLAGPRGPSDYPLETRIDECGLRGRVRALGYVSEELLESLYAHALVFVYPSLYEGFGFPPLEAMARGVPTIVSNASALPEVVGADAVCVDPQQPEELTQALKRLIGDASCRGDLIERGRRRAEQFTWKQSAERHLELYESVMSRNEHSPSCV